MSEVWPGTFDDERARVNPRQVKEIAATLRSTGRYGSEADEVAADVLAAIRATGMIVTGGRVV